MVDGPLCEDVKASFGVNSLDYKPIWA